MGFLNLVEQDDRVRVPPYCLRQLTALIVTDIARRSADQSRHRVLLRSHITAHVSAKPSEVLYLAVPL